MHGVERMFLEPIFLMLSTDFLSSHRFWEDALQHGVIAHLKLTEAVVWDELPPEELHEAIIGIRSHLFMVHCMKIIFTFLQECKI